MGMRDLLNEMEDEAGEGLLEMNPFHNAAYGEFTSPQEIKRLKKGSISAGGKKQRFKSKQFRKIKPDCGREAREQGYDKRCWDGKKGKASDAHMAKAGKAFKGKSRKNEDFGGELLSILSEV